MGFKSLPTPALPGFASTHYYTIPTGSTVGTQLLTSNRLYFWPFFQGANRNVSFDRIAVDITTGAGDSTCEIRWGIYRMANGRPSSLVLDAGVTVVGTGTGEKTVTIAQSLPPGWYCLAIISNTVGGGGALPTIRSNANEARNFLNWLQGIVDAGDTQTAHLLYNDETVASWASYTLPATATSILGADGTLAPIILIRAA